MNTTDDFNKTVIQSIGSLGDDDGDNWIATTFGKRAAGFQVSDEMLPERCPLCGQPDYDSGQAVIAKRRLNTAYVDDKKNWLVSCESCFEERVAEYQEMWDEYWSMVL